MYPKAKLVNELSLDPDLLRTADISLIPWRLQDSILLLQQALPWGDYDAGAVAASVIDQMVQAGALRMES